MEKWRVFDPERGPKSTSPFAAAKAASAAAEMMGREGASTRRCAAGSPIRGNYSPLVAIGSVMRALAVGEVVVSRHPDYSPGEIVTGWFGWQDLATVLEVNLTNQGYPTFGRQRPHRIFTSADIRRVRRNIKN